MPTLDRIETLIKTLEPKKIGSFKWGSKEGETVVIDECFAMKSIELEDLGFDLSLHTARPYMQHLLAIIQREDPDTIHLGVNVSEVTYEEIRAVRGSAINRDPVLGKRFRYMGNEDSLTKAP